MRTLLIDNYDSYTCNLFHLRGEIAGEEPLVERNDGISWIRLATERFDNVVISPGPGRPDRAQDVGVARDAVCHARVRVLGVCLGTSSSPRLGGSVVRANQAVHGLRSPVRHDGRGLFARLPQEFAAVRYHSLIVQCVPRSLRVTGTTPDGAIMGLAHRAREPWGVQFHGRCRQGLARRVSGTRSRFGAQPIKGAAPRDRDPPRDAELARRLADDVKRRAENLMIADLVRHDLGGVAELGSVEVPRLMAVESYSTVHESVTTVRARLRDGASTVDCIPAAFPEGR